MILSGVGTKMASPSGLRSIMEDIATTTAAAAPGERFLNLGIGNPAYIPEVAETWRRLTAAALATDFGEASCRYGPSRGSRELVGAVVRYLGEHLGWDIGPRNVVVGPGSQMLCFIAAAMFTGAGAPRPAGLVLPMSPDYTGYQGLTLAAGQVTGVEAALRRGTDRSFTYEFDFDALRRRTDLGLLMLSTPSNPTGRSLTAAELDQLIDVAASRDVPLLVDNAYGEPFPGIGEDALPPRRHDNVINCFTLSKAGLPGERIGFAVGPERYIAPMVSFLANSALHAPQLMQAAVAVALSSGAMDELVSTAIRPFYAQRRKVVEKMLFGKLPAGIDWRLHAGQGGMFCWLWIDQPWFDDLVFYEALKREGVFVVPGRHFFTDPTGAGGFGRHARQCFRLSISADLAALSDGIGRIARVLDEMSHGGPAPARTRETV
ncbi:aminotransferase class I/II-fold pyridoxal phosphate-dependent enzyme [Rhizomonospora bruguierae]|uniref:aminotransferase class I/II-fold pyridoxal phosphate-dependent enzyme n=1 Tax=Rhizomonospora bruguierae TaxID=1581705 RepID=UPI001BCDC7E7|nr:aminotransferase class I/II-fold pyridoxal phosphate-dependent enzyme [Micromonospora sp. NBRC 107566]